MRRVFGLPLSRRRQSYDDPDKKPND